MKNFISSRNNPFIKYLIALQKEPSFRRTERAFVMEGVSLSAEALASGMAMKLVAAQNQEDRPEVRLLLQDARHRGVEVVTVTEGLMKAVSNLTTSPGVMAVVKMQEWSEDEILKSRRPILLLCGLQDPGNVGTIIRAAEAAGARGVFYTPGTVDPYNPKVVRSTMGSILRVPVLSVGNGSNIVERSSQAGYRTIATGMRQTTTCFETDLKTPFLLIIGQEAAGLPPDLTATADLTVSIPMEGKVESINAAMAAGIILFEAKRQRGVSW